MGGPIETQVRAFRRPEYNKIVLYARSRRGNEEVFATADWRHVRHDGTYCDELLMLSDSEAQMLMDSLWECGLRPAGGIGSVGQLAATERHLNDMRVIAFCHGIKMELPDHK